MKWYKSAKHDDHLAEVKSLTQSREDNGPKKDETIYSMQEMQAAASENPAVSDRGAYMRIQGTVVHIMDQADRPMYYLSCLTCKKKVQQEANGYRCEGCQKSYEEAKPQYNFSVKLSDYSDSIFISILGETGDTILGMTAKEYVDLQEEGQNMSEVLRSSLFKHCDFVIKAQLRANMNGEERMNFMAVRSCDNGEHDFVADSKQLLKKLEIYKSK